MEQRTDSPYPKKDRPILAVIGVLLVVSTLLFAWSDRKHDWRYYQYAFREQVAEKLGAEKAKTIPSGVQQIWVSEMRRADRCITCHQAMLWKGFEKADNPFKSHPARAAQGPPDREVRLHVLPRRAGLGDRRGLRARPGRALGRAAARHASSARPTRSPRRRPRSCR